MISTILIAVVIIAVGTRAADAVRLRQQETILAKLPTADAVAYFRILRRRAWTVRILRTIALVSLVIIIYARNRGWQRDHVRARPSAVEQVTHSPVCELLLPGAAPVQKLAGLANREGLPTGG